MLQKIVLKFCTIASKSRNYPFDRGSRFVQHALQSFVFRTLSTSYFYLATDLKHSRLIELLNQQSYQKSGEFPFKIVSSLKIKFHVKCQLIKPLFTSTATSLLSNHGELFQYTSPHVVHGQSPDSLPQYRLHLISFSIPVNSGKLLEQLAAHSDLDLQQALSFVGLLLEIMDTDKHVLDFQFLSFVGLLQDTVDRDSTDVSTFGFARATIILEIDCIPFL